jgi:crotonobetainyl-CoA:carnitine CoA-transferase CaiB-like acyl-CoA transferase
MVQSFEHPVVGRFSCLPLPWKFDTWDGLTVARPPLLGEHTEQVLRDDLGYEPERIAALKEARAI